MKKRYIVSYHPATQEGMPSNTWEVFISQDMQPRAWHSVAFLRCTKKGVTRFVFHLMNDQALLQGVVEHQMGLDEWLDAIIQRQAGESDGV